MQTQEEAARISDAVTPACSLHWLTELMHEASKVGLNVQPSGTWSSPHEETQDLLLRFSCMLSSHENSPPSVLSWLAGFEDSRLQTRIAEHPNTPEDVLHKLVRSKFHDVRAAIADNPSTPFELLFALSRDEQADVRYRLAENALLPQEILDILCEDENPYVAHRAQQSLRRRSERRPPQPSTPLSCLSVLIVDDDEVTRLILALSLKSDPLINLVGQANCGEIGIKMAIEHQPDIVLMDIGMPGMNGITATSEIKTMVPRTRVIMVTAHDTLEEIISAFGHGAEGYHLKSTPNHDLGKAIRVVATGSYWLDPGVASMVLRELSKKSLSILQAMSRDSNETDLPNPVLNLLSTVEDYVLTDNLLHARQICQAALSLSQTLYGDLSATTNRAMSRLAELYFLEEEYSSSESTYLDLVRMQSRLHELDDPALDNYLSLLAEFYEFRWNHEQAELFFTWLLRVREKTGNAQKISEAKARLEEIARRSLKFKTPEAVSLGNEGGHNVGIEVSRNASSQSF